MSCSKSEAGPNTLPPNLDELTKEELINLLKRTSAERDKLALELATKKKRQKKSLHLCESELVDSITTPSTEVGTEVPIKLASVVASDKGTVTPGNSGTSAVLVEGIDVHDTKQRILKNATAKIKKTVHTDRNKPYTEVLECVPSETAVIEIMKGYIPKSNNNFMKWTLKEVEILDWLGIHDSPLIHPVTNKINTICLAGEKPNIYAHAKIESVEIKWERKSGSLTMKFRTAVAGFGRPGFYAPK